MRREGWEHRLTDLITAAQTRDFTYGTWDRCLFACAAISALTDHDPGAKYRGMYSVRYGLEALLERHGGVRMIAYRAAADCAFAEIPPVQAQRGDVVLGRIADRATLGVCVGSLVAFAVAPRGLHTVPITDPSLLVAWRVA